jgi:predicted TIM-barrel enzyme
MLKKGDKSFVEKGFVIAPIFLGGKNNNEKYERAIREINIYLENDINGILATNYYADIETLKRILEYLKNNCSHIPYGVQAIVSASSIDNDATSFRLANEHDASFVRLDDISGSEEEINWPSYEYQYNKLRESSDAFVFGRIRLVGNTFDTLGMPLHKKIKIERIPQFRTWKDDVIKGMERSDALVVSAPSKELLGEIERYKKLELDKLFVVEGHSLTSQNVDSVLSNVDGVIASHCLRSPDFPHGELDKQKIQVFMKKVNKYRAK